MIDLRVEGSPGQCRVAAEELRGAQRTYEQVAAVLAEVADASKAAWHGIAAEGFRAVLAHRRQRATSAAVVARELAAGLDLLADGLTAARADMDRARATLASGGVHFSGDTVPPPFVIAATAADPARALAAYDRAQRLIELGRTVEASAQQSWYAAISGALRELGGGPPAVAISESKHGESSGLFDGIPGLDRLGDLIGSPPGLPFGPIPLEPLAEVLKNTATGGNPTLAGMREFVEQLIDDQDRGDLDLAERLARAGLVAGTTFAAGSGAAAMCTGLGAPQVAPVCTRVGVAGGSWLGNWLIDKADER